MSKENEVTLWVGAMVLFVMFTLGTPWPVYVGFGVMTVGTIRVPRTSNYLRRLR